MGRYQSYTRQEVKKRPWDVHPVWRGIGCILLIVIPIMAYAGGVILVRENFKNKWVALPPELTRSIVIPYFGRLFYADVAVAILLMVAGFGLMIIIYAMMYKLLGPARYGPLDSPPIKRKRKRRR